MPRYWVVGAWWKRGGDRYQDFIRGGYWLLGWSDEDDPLQAALRDDIKAGDHIAIKKRGAGSNIEIRALGVVKKNDPRSHRVHVRWVETDLHRLVHSHGCYKSIHRFSEDDKWAQEVFEPSHVDVVSDGSDLPDLDDDHRLGLEGGRSWRLHLMIERNRENVERKKKQVKRDTGSLDCEACGFNFAGFYGDLGGDFCEVHHRLPLFRVNAPVRPDLGDLAIVCSNCHRMIHKTCPMMSVEEFREMLRRLGRLQ